MNFLRRWTKAFVHSACAFCVLGLACGPTAAQNGYYSSANALFLNGPNSDQQVVTQHIAILPGTAWLRTDDADFDVRPGMEITLGKHLDELTSIEGSYFGLHRWSASASAADPNENLNAPSLWAAPSSMTSWRRSNRVSRHRPTFTTWSSISSAN